jgi:hypothetical protein
VKDIERCARTEDRLKVAVAGCDALEDSCAEGTSTAAQGRHCWDSLSFAAAARALLWRDLLPVMVAK